MSDDDATLRSKHTPTGHVVNTEKEAKEWCAKGSWIGERIYKGVWRVQ